MLSCSLLFSLPLICGGARPSTGTGDPASRTKPLSSNLVGEDQGWRPQQLLSRRRPRVLRELPASLGGPGFLMERPDTHLTEWIETHQPSSGGLGGRCHTWRACAIQGDGVSSSPSRLWSPENLT